jgi:hypothetical protein
VHCKACLIAKGYHQQQGLDISETFSLAAEPISIRTIPSIVVTSSWCLWQINIQSAFLHCFLGEEVFMVAS